METERILAAICYSTGYFDLTTWNEAITLMSVLLNMFLMELSKLKEKLGKIKNEIKKNNS